MNYGVALGWKAVCHNMALARKAYQNHTKLFRNGLVLVWKASCYGMLWYGSKMETIPKSCFYVCVDAYPTSLFKPGPCPTGG